MAKKEQIAVCQRVATRKTKTGEKEVYTLVLDGKEFEVWEGDYFQAKEGMRFTPVISVVPVAYHGKDGRAYANMKPVVNWEVL